LVGCFAIGITPKGGGDPQGLRRAALGLIRTLVDRGIHADLGELLGEGIDHFHAAVRARPEGMEAWTKARGTGEVPQDREGLVSELVEFVVARFKASAAASADVVDAVVAATRADPLVLQRKVDALASLAGNTEFSTIMTTFKRVLNISRGHDFPPPERAALTHDAERALFDATAAVEGEIARAAEALDYATALDRILVLRAPIAALFDAVMVDAPDPTEKSVRIGLLLRIARSFLMVADFSRISTR
jgi:glycyl-tRNA synthetase beta chain